MPPGPGRLALRRLDTLETLLFGADLAGWPTLAASIMLFPGVQPMSIGASWANTLPHLMTRSNSAPAICSPRDEDYSKLAQQ